MHVEQVSMNQFLQIQGHTMPFLVELTPLVDFSCLSYMKRYEKIISMAKNFINLALK